MCQMRAWDLKIEEKRTLVERSLIKEKNKNFEVLPSKFFSGGIQNDEDLQKKRNVRKRFAK